VKDSASTLGFECTSIAVVVMLGAQGCCRMTGNFGGGPCPSEEKPERHFRVRLASTCSPATRLWYDGGSPESTELSQADFDALRAGWWHAGDFVLVDEDIALRSDSVTVWTHVPGQSKYVGFVVGLKRWNTTKIDIVCDAAGIPREAR
jgi:hypothetical protein